MIKETKAATQITLTRARAYMYIAVGDRNIYTLAVNSRTIYGGRARNRSTAVSVWTNFPSFSAVTMSIQDAYGLFIELGVHDTLMFEELCREKNWFVPSGVVLGDEEL